MKKLLCALILIGFYSITAFATNNVTFQVNMKLQMQTTNFDKNKDTIVVRGDFYAGPDNWWQSNKMKLTDPDGDSIYVGTFDVGTVPKRITFYKYVMVTSEGTDRWEQDMGIPPQRTDTIPLSPWTLPVVWFHNDSIYNDITFQVNMGVQAELLRFDKAKDSVVVRGDFNYYWNFYTPNAYLLKSSNNNNIYSGTHKIIAGKQFRYKFVIHNSAYDSAEINYRSDSTLDGTARTYPVVWFNDEFPFIFLTPLSDSLKNGINYNISWQTNVEKINLEYSINNGTSWSLIDSNINANILNYNWQVPVVAPASSQCKIRIRNTNDSTLFDESTLFTMYAKVHNPVLGVNGGTYNTSQNVTITASTPQAEIRYTIEGSEPTQSSLLYSQAIKIDSSQTLKARAFKPDWSSSDIIAASYLLEALMPSFSPVAGSYSAPQTVTISSASDSVKIYFTLDGSEPTETSPLYSSPVLIDTNKTLKAKAFKKGWVISDTRTGNYTIAGQVFTVSFNTPSIWFDANFDGKESKTITPITSISYGSIISYEWKIGNNVIGTSNSVNAELPTGTWYVVLSMTSDRGIVKKDSVKISVYAAEATTTGSIESAVSQLSENIYFVTSKGGGVYRFDTTGVIAWTIQTGGSIQSTTCVSSQDNIYVGSNDTRLYSFDYQGTPRWDKAMGGTIVSSPSSVFDTLIYVGISTGRLFALDEAGNIKWSVQTGGAIYSSPSIDVSGVAYFGSDDNKLYAVSSNGTILWTYSAIAPIRTSPALGADSSIVFGSLDGFVYKVGKDGQVKWDVFVGGSVKSSPIIGLDGIIYIGSNDGKLYSLAKDGQKLWGFNAGSPINVTPALSADGTIYFGTMNGTIFALDQNGKQKWMLQTGKPILAPMLVTNSKMLMVGDTLGKVYIMKIPSDSALVNLNTEFVASTKNISESSYEWWTFKGNNQRTGYRKSIITSVKNHFQKIPEKFALRQNYPNPFNPTTIIEYDLPKDSRVKILVFDMLGRQVRMLVDEEKSGGSYKVEFNANNLSSGVYFYHLQTNEFAQTKKLVLMR